jgi:hypothetical protein
MSLVWQMLDKLLAWMQGETPLQLALLFFCCTTLVVGSIALAARRLRPTRLEERRVVGRPVLISWRDCVGLRQSDDGLCQNISAGGMGLDLPFPLKVGTHLKLRMSEAQLSCSGVVKRCTRMGPRYVVGVQYDASPSGLNPRHKELEGSCSHQSASE